MDTKTPLSLEQILLSYNLLILFLVIFVILMIVLMVKNYNGFNKLFGYEIFITGPMLVLLSIIIKEIFAFNKNPQNSWLNIFPQSKENWFLPVVSLVAIFIGLFSFFMMLYISGVFSSNPPQNNSAVILNFVVIILFIIITGLIYTNSKSKDNIILNSLPKGLHEIFELRTKYTMIFALFTILLTILYFVNPWGLMTKYGGPVMFFSLFVGIVMVIMITIYQYYLANPSKIGSFKDTPGFFGLLAKGGYILGALGISFGLIYGVLSLMGVFNQDASKSSWGNIIFNIILLCSMFGIIYKLANAGGFLDKNPYYRLFLNIILYIPCLLVTIINSILKTFGFVPSSTSPFSPPKPFEIKMLGLSLVLLSGYFGWVFLAKPYLQSKYLKQGGLQLINQPVKTDILTNVASYQSLNASSPVDEPLNHTGKINYTYAISFWVYLDAFPPSTNASYNKIVSLLSYGENPNIKYSSANNTFYITVKQIDEGSNGNNENNGNNKNKKETSDNITLDAINKWKNVKDTIANAIENIKAMPFGNETDSDGHRIIYKHPDVQLQKWNHILLNYNGGTLDVFYNGNLVKSAIEVVPYIKFDMLTVGTENGVSGNIANLMYFKHPLDILTINTLYMSLKDKNPPVIPENKQNLIPHLK